MSNPSRSYTELSCFSSFEDRFNYLSLKGNVGVETFGFDRWINQTFYNSIEWLSVREEVILRDNGCDLGVIGFELSANLLVHHMNPMTLDDLKDGVDWIIDPEFLITTSKQTHNQIHYGGRGLLPKPYIERLPRDTNLW